VPAATHVQTVQAAPKPTPAPVVPASAPKVAAPVLRPAAEPPEPIVTPAPPPDSHHGEASDEDAEAAAMRAIESSWRRKPARKPIRDLPEGVDGS
jgi:hypothetical protein